MPINFVLIFLLFILHTTCLRLLCPVRFGIKKTAFIWSSVILSSSVAAFVLMQTLPLATAAYIAMTVTIVPGVVTVFYLSSYPLPKTLFLFFTYVQSFWVILFLSGLLSNLYFDGRFISAAIIRTILHIGIVLLCAVFRNPFAAVSRQIPRGWWPLNLVAALFVVYLGYLSPLSYAPKFNSFVLVSFVLLLTIIIAVNVVFFHTIRHMNKAARTKRAELQSEFLLGQMEAMQEAVDATGRARHDMRHHNLLIAQYAEKGQVDELLQYLGEYENASDIHDESSYCENIAASNILCAYVRKAKKLGIEVRLAVALEQDIAIQDIDLVAILANLMENAINGCIHSKKSEPFIELHIGRKASKLAIYVKNTAGGDIQFEDGVPKSKNGDGIGITSILSSAKRYGGEYDFALENGVFSCQLLLKASKTLVK